MRHRLDSSDKKIKIRKGIINADSIQEFRDILSEVDWGNLYSISDHNDAYENFLKIFSGIYDLAYPLKTPQNYLGREKLRKILRCPKAF